MDEVGAVKKNSRVAREFDFEYVEIPDEKPLESIGSQDLLFEFFFFRKTNKK